MESYLSILIYLIIGLLLKRVPGFIAETGVVLNQFVIYVSLPAVVLLQIPKLALSGQALVPALMPWVALLFSVGLVLVVSRLLRWRRSITGCMLLLIPLGNTSFLGIPMVQTFFGDSGIPYLVLYDQLGTFLALATYGSLIVAIYGSGEAKPTGRRVIRKILTFPPFLALVIAFLIRGPTYPSWMGSLLSALAATLIPLVMIAVGYQLTPRLDRDHCLPLSVGLFIKLVATPLVVLAISLILGLKGEPVQVTVFEAGMPSMISAGALAIMANLAPPLAAALVGVGIIASFATLPLLYQLIRLVL